MVPDIQDPQGGNIMYIRCSETVLMVHSGSLQLRSNARPRRGYLGGRPYHLHIEGLPDVQECSRDRMVYIRCHKMRITAPIASQMLLSDWVERVGQVIQNHLFCA